LVPGLALLLVVGLAAAAVARLAGAMASTAAGALLTYTPQKGELLVTITEDGNLESAANRDIKCEVAGGSTILWIVEDGQLVQEGDVLARLDSSQLEDQINQQKITYEKARSAHIQAEKDYSVAKISVQEYVDGTYRKDIQVLEAQIKIALENLRSAQNTLRHTQRMFRKGYVSPLQRESQEFAVQRAQLDLDSAQTAKDVLEKYTKLKTLEDLQSKRDTAEAKEKSERAAFELEEARLKRLQAQLQKCVIRAPQSGMAVYANEVGGHRGMSQTPQVEEGALVREQQTLFRLPDLSKMQVKVTVHESKVDQLRPGMRARIRIQDQVFHGTIDSIANQPEASGWFAANVKEYATIVKIAGDQKGLKPGMTAEVEILVADLKDVVTLPVAAVVEQRSKFYCWVKTPEKSERRPLVLGLSNDKFVEVKDGVAAGEEVVLNPRTVIAEAREEGGEETTPNVENRFGTSSAERQEGPAGAGGRRPPQSPSAGGGPQGPPGAPAGTGQPGRPDPSAPGGGRGRGPGEGGGRGMMQLDRDGDGKISRDEAPQRMRDSFDQLDTNGDGFIDAAETSALRGRLGPGGRRPEEGRSGPGQPGGGPPSGDRPDRNPPGRGSP
jgi:RND family efflux transporter MFP subunit